MAKIPKGRVMALLTHFLEPVKDKSTFQCVTTCTIAYQALALARVPRIHWWKCSVPTRHHRGKVIESCGHYFLEVDGAFADWAYRQFDPKSRWPIYIPKDHHQVDALYPHRERLERAEILEIMDIIQYDGRLEVWGPVILDIGRALQLEIQARKEATKLLKKPRRR